jgi:Protein of unknown function (DUF3800)
VPSVDELVEALQGQERDCVFIDDSGAAGHALLPEVLEPNYACQAAVHVRADSLAGLDEAHDEWLTQAGKLVPRLTEFHGTEIANPGTRSPWRGVPQPARAELLDLAAATWFPFVDHVLFLGLPEAQYNELLGKARSENPDLSALARPEWRRHKPGLDMVLLSAVGQYAGSLEREVVVIEDNGTHQNGFLHLYNSKLGVWRDGVVYMDSRRLAGLQLADFVAFAIFRQFVLRDREARGRVRTPIDAALDGAARMLFETKRVLDATRLSEADVDLPAT